MKDNFKNSAVSASTTTTSVSEGGNNMINDAIDNIISEINAGNIDKKELEARLAALNTGSTRKRAKVAKNKQIHKRFKAYSEENVMQIIHMIDEGKTSLDIKERFGICKQTIKNYLWKHYEKKGYAEKLWDKLLENDRRAAEQENAHTDAEAEVETVVEEEAEAVAIAETENEVEEQPSEECESTELPRILIDQYFVISHEGRQYWNDIINKLETEGYDYVIYSRYKMGRIARQFTPAAAELAKDIIKNKGGHLIETNLRMIWAAESIGATVLTFSKKTEEACAKIGVACIQVEDFLTNASNEDVFEIDPNDEEAAMYCKKLKLPVTLNKMRRAIASLPELAEFFVKSCYMENPIVQIVDCNNNPKKTLTDKIRLVPGDILIAEDEELLVKLKFEAETEGYNSYVVFSSSAKNRKSKAESQAI